MDYSNPHNPNKMSELYKKFGELLKIERNRKALKLEDLSEQLKISVTNLEYIEAGEIGSLPSKIYYNLFAKAYAESLGIDFERTIEAIKEDLGELTYNGDTGSSKPAPDKPQKKKPAEQKKDAEERESAASIKKLLYLFGAIVVVFIIFLVIFLIFFSSEKPITDEQTSTRQASQPAVVDSDHVTSDTGGTSYDWNVPEYRVPQKLRLKLTPRNESWSTVLADGDTVIFRNLIPGRVYDAEADYRLIVSVGIPSQVDIELNGKAVDLSDPGTGRISRVEINQVNADSFFNRDALESVSATTPGPANDQRPADTAGNSGGLEDDET
ncbi:MAG: RodZ domain-containing protein [Candidatus Zixiibacteriota bacterium]